ncbi:hypothetical protein BAU15_03010 [Enterococcus sp. JM4C]|uniref:hypothetical protein n=1 Tax=Candidatus Enterococcus huntleyi TaxID=1857217 RepID=UPI001379A12C|nr:hypothetical protein [Enterococcus sp. JM4C]KAF1295528.1 hypothetical protein BAU15_03010 [Enterococcus sp. JM4C]
MRPNLGFYVQTINDIVTDTEKIGEEMNPSYEKLRTALDENKLDSLSSEELKEISTLFETGTDKYRAMSKKISTLRPPAAVMGIHKKFERSYLNYVAGCEEMLNSINTADGIDKAAFDAAEEKQDTATDEIAFAIQRMTNLLLKK